MLLPWSISGTWQTTLSLCLPVGCFIHVIAVPLAVDPGRDPSNGDVRIILRTCDWNQKFCINASLCSNCRLDAATNPEDMAVTCASWITASFSLSNLDLSSLGDNSDMIDATMESANDAEMTDLLASSSISMAIFCEVWKLAAGFKSPKPRAHHCWMTWNGV